MNNNSELNLDDNPPTSYSPVLPLTSSSVEMSLLPTPAGPGLPMARIDWTLAIDFQLDPAMGIAGAASKAAFAFGLPLPDAIAFGRALVQISARHRGDGAISYQVGGLELVENEWKTWCKSNPGNPAARRFA
jgi:hypothetical protein